MTEADRIFNVTIYLRGDNLDPAHVSTVLGIEPSRSQSKGEKRVTPTNHEFVTKTGIWALAAEVKSNDLSKPIEELASKLGNRGPQMPDIAGVADAHVDVFVATDADENGGGTCEFQLSKAALQSLSNIGIPVQFTIAVIKK